MSALISGTPDLSNVPSILQKRDMANCAMRDPTTGVRNIVPSQARRPTGERNHCLSKIPTVTNPANANKP